jgi:hypothetical protein
MTMRPIAERLHAAIKEVERLALSLESEGNAKVCQCGGNARTVDSRPVGFTVRRRRVCETCGRKWTTREARVGPDDEES